MVGIGEPFFRPWAGGNDILYTLSKLASLDKHQLIVPLAFSVDFINMMEIDLTGQDANCEILDPQWNEDTRDITVLLTPRPHGLKGINAAAAFAFGPVTGVAGKPAVPFLNEAATMVENAIAAIAIAR